MTDSPTDHRAVMALWPSLTDFAGDIGVSYNTAKQMRRRNSIAVDHHASVVEAAKRRRIARVNFGLLARTSPSRGSRWNTEARAS